MEGFRGLVEKIKKNLGSNMQKKTPEGLRCKNFKKKKGKWIFSENDGYFGNFMTSPPKLTIRS